MSMIFQYGKQTNPACASFKTSVETEAGKQNYIRLLFVFT